MSGFPKYDPEKAVQDPNCPMMSRIDDEDGMHFFWNKSWWYTLGWEYKRNLENYYLKNKERIDKNVALVEKMLFRKR